MKHIISIILLIISSFSISAQFDQNVEFIEITMNDGTLKKGIFISLDKSEITYNANGQNYTVERSQVKEFKLGKSSIVAEAKDDERKNYPESYFIFPSALPAGKGSMYYRNYNIFVNQFTIGLTDNLTLMAGFESVSILAGAGVPVIFIAPKISFGKDNVHVGLGTTVFVYEDNYAGLLFANTTIGSDRSNLTIGVSYVYNGEDFSNPYLFNINGAVSLSQKVSLIGEAIVFQKDYVSLNLGIRYTTRSNIAIDAAVIKFDDADFLIPILGITLPFGKEVI